MKETNNYLFVFGTLPDKDNEYGNYLSNNCTFHTRGKFKGNLYEIGENTGAIYQPNSGLFIYGDVFIMNNPDETLKILDEYEGFGENEEKPNLFTSEVIEVETDKGQIDWRIYLYNLRVNGLMLIISGKHQNQPPP